MKACMWYSGYDENKDRAENECQLKTNGKGHLVEITSQNKKDKMVQYIFSGSGYALNISSCIYHNLTKLHVCM